MILPSEKLGLKIFMHHAAFRLLSFLIVTAVFCHRLPAEQSCKIPSHQTLSELESKKNIDQVLLLVQKRLALMHEVARTKWSQNLLIEDLDREKQLIADVKKRAESYGLDEAWTGKFFQAQFDAAKKIQKSDFDFWNQQGAPRFVSFLDLKQEIRPYLDQLSNELLESLGRIYPEISNGKLSSSILAMPLSRRPSDDIDEDVWQAAVFPLINPHDGQGNG